MAHLHPVEDYLKARGDRAIAASLLHAGALLAARRETLRLHRQTVQIEAALIRYANGTYLHHLGRRAADYYRDHGRLRQLANRLGRRLDRRWADVKKLA